ncbi:peptidoglycan-binding domain-containing protein [Flavobacterium sp.]|uniref:peptidoglycan-binding domain-containing protein n=1 Tax=Flavobacterium sp. TaxID=239 RepID=UPI003D6B99AC
MTTEDKLWIGGGIALAVGGGIYYFVQKSKNDKELLQEPEADLSEETLPNTTPVPIRTPPLSTAPIVPVKTVAEPPVRSADTFRYSIGQQVMASGFNGTKTYDARKMADGNYTSEGIRKATFKKGDKIGTIIWVGRRPDGTYRYVAQRNGAFMDDIYWIPDHSVIKPVGKILPTVPATAEASGIDKTKLLQKGSKGMEVRTLQTLLKIKVDGDFGRNTENALYTQKGVKQIRLNNWK